MQQFTQLLLLTHVPTFVELLLQSQVMATNSCSTCGHTMKKSLSTPKLLTRAHDFSEHILKTNCDSQFSLELNILKQNKALVS